MTDTGSGTRQEEKIVEVVSNAVANREFRGRKKSDSKIYKNLICAFDIETTRLEEIEQSIMYLWQFSVLDLESMTITTIYGRLWEEFVNLINRIEDENCYLMIFVHNLSYEFQFLRSILPINDVMALKSRSILRANMGRKGRLEFRCSYHQTHKSLFNLLSDYDVPHKKLTDFDYSVRRYPWTQLSERELEYGCNDVIGLVEAMYMRLKQGNDTLYSLPLTSTGYVRRKAKNAMKSFDYRKLHDMMPNIYLYDILREEFRGGDTHANRYYVGKIMADVKSFDRSSSYPDVMLNCEFPMTKFIRQGNVTMDDLQRYTKFHNCYIARFVFTGLQQKDVYYGCPYISKDKSRNYEGEVVDNGRILSADKIEVTLNDIDLKIVLNEYIFDNVEIRDCYTARYDYLPKELRELVKELFVDKTTLKGVEGKELLYMLQKELINALYGMAAQNPVKPDILFENNAVGNPFELKDGDRESKLEQYNRKAFLLYAWGCWVTAWARYRLKEAVNIVGDDFIYCDTDSCKFRVSNKTPDILEALDKLNDRLRSESVKNGGVAYDKKGRAHYLGVYEEEHPYTEFKTLGAKKYAYKYEDGTIGITIAGVNKKEGAKELIKAGGLSALKIGYTFTDGGGAESVYNDSDYGKYAPDPENPEKVVNITRNIVIRPSTYTVGLTLEFLRVLESPELWHDYMENEKLKKGVDK